MKPLLLLFISLIVVQNIYSEKLFHLNNPVSFFIEDSCCICEDAVPYYHVDLNGSPDSIWILEGKDVVKREGQCCVSEDPNTVWGCISFNVYLDEYAVGLIMDVKSPAPAGVEYYRINCGEQIPLGELICLTGGQTYTLTFCKSGEDRPDYVIQSIPGIQVRDSINITQETNSTRNFQVSGLVPSTINWSVIYPSMADSLLNYLDLTDLENPVFIPDSFTPSKIIYEVCGTLNGVFCDGVPVADCADVIFVFNDSNNLIMDNNENLKSSSDFIIYPNPNSGLFNVEFSSNNSNKALLEIFNSSGQILLRKEIKETNNLFQEQINLYENPNGIYYLRINSKGRIFSKNLIIQKQ